MKHHNRDSAAALPGYIKRLIEAPTLATLVPGTVAQAIIRHDGWCSLLARQGTCDCSPAIEIRWPKAGEVGR